MIALITLVLFAAIIAMAASIFKPDLLPDYIYPRKNRTRQQVFGDFLGLIVVGFFSLIFMGMMVDDKVEGQDETSISAKALPSTYNEAIGIIADNELKYSDIRKASKNFTEAQYDDYKSYVQGKSIDVIGYVIDVEEGANGYYEILVDYDSLESVLSIQDIYAYTKDKNILDLAKGDRIYIHGEIKSISNLLGSETVNITNAKIKKL